MCMTPTPGSVKEQPAPPPPPDAFDQKVRGARAATRERELRAKGRQATTLLGQAASSSGTKTLLGQ